MDFYLGEIRAFACNVPGGPAPRGWHVCDGSVLQVAQNQALFSLLRNAYGGDGVKTFALPDLRGRAMLSQGQVPATGTVYVVGKQGGTETVALTTAQMPQHSHNLTASTGAATAATPVGNLPAMTTTPNLSYAAAQNAQATLAADALGSCGGAAHNNMQPSLVINYCIATVGLYPTRAE